MRVFYHDKSSNFSVLQPILFVVLLLIGVCLSEAHAQPTKDYKLSGKVIDSATNLPLKFVTIALLNADKAVGKILSNEKGDFLLTAPTSGEYLLSIVHVGYGLKKIKINVGTLSGLLDLGTISLSPVSKEISEVLIKSKRPLLTQKIDRIVYNVQEDPQSKFASLFTILKKVPLIDVDGEERVTLQGQGGFKVLIDNKPSVLLARSLKDVFKSMPASSIKSIEVITSPSAKYDSEGLAGIINIVTIKKFADGYEAYLSAEYQNPVGGSSFGGSMSFKQGKIGVTLMSGYSSQQRPETSSDLTRQASDLINKLNQRGLRSITSNSVYAGSEISYDIDSVKLLTARFRYNNQGEDEHADKSTHLFVNNLLVDDVHFTSEGNNEWNGVDFLLNYQQSGRENKSRIFNFSYQFSDNKEVQLNALNNLDILSGSETLFNQSNVFSQNENTFQLDYTHPFKKVKFETGLKGILRLGDSESQTSDFIPGKGYVVDPAAQDVFENNQYIWSAYATGQYEFNKWGIIVGARLERTQVNAKFLITGNSIHSNYNNLIPSITVNYNFAKNQAFNVSFNQRIQRPNIRLLNPFVDRINPTLEIAGNPKLEPVLTNNFNLRYRHLSGHPWTLTFGYIFANNTVERILATTSSSSVARYTYRNIGSYSSTGLSFTYNHTISDPLSIGINGFSNYLQLTGNLNGIQMHNSGFVNSIKANIDYSFQSMLQLNFNFRYTSSSVLIQGKTETAPNYSFSAAKPFLNNKLNFSATINNPFAKYRYLSSELVGNNFTQSVYSQVSYRSFLVSVGYKFGKLKSRFKKAKKTILNNDLIEGN